MSIELLPQNATAEQQVIGSMLLDCSVVDDVAATVRPEHFYVEKHQAITTAIFRLRDAGHDGIDVAVLADALDKTGQLQDVGGLPYLVELLESVPHAVHAVYYAEIVRDKFRHRTGIIALNDALRKLKNPTAAQDVVTALAEAEHGLHAAIEAGQVKEPARLADLLPQTLAALSTGKGIQQTATSGFDGVNNHIGGIPMGAVTIVAARPSIGKTSLMLGMSMRIAEAGVPALFVSYEQTQLEMTSRGLSLCSFVPLTNLQRGTMTSTDNERIVDAGNQLAASPLYLDESCLDESGLMAMIRTQVRKRGVRVVVVDYLQLIPPSDRKAIREQQVAGISRALKLVAMQTGAAVIVASQLNRAVEKRDNKRPQLQDLRESGAIEQDADIVMFLHRPNKDSQEEPDDYAELIIAKNRNGPTGDIKLAWNGRCARYSDWMPSFGGSDE